MAGSVFRVPSRAFVRKRKSEAAPHVTQPVHACVYACFTNYSRPLSHNRCFRPRAEAREKEGAGVRHKGRDRKDGADRVSETPIFHDRDVYLFALTRGRGGDAILSVSIGALFFHTRYSSNLH